MPEARQLVLIRATELLPRNELATRLKIPQSLLDAWIGGHAKIPDRKFVMLVDLIDALTSESAP